MSEIAFETYRPLDTNINEIGITADHSGVFTEISTVFGYEGSDPQELLALVAPHKHLQDNIATVRDALSDPTRAAQIGYADRSAGFIAHDWVERSGLLTAVDRPLLPDAGRPVTDNPTVSVMTEGVVNWMKRNTQTMLETAVVRPGDTALLVYSGRVIRDGEHSEAVGGTSVEDYVTDVLKPQLERSGLFADVLVAGTDATDGKSVMNAAAEALQTFTQIPEQQIIMNAVAGNWIQKGVQLRRAIQAVTPTFDTNPEIRQLWVRSDSIAVGITGDEATEPKTSYQNPFSAIGNILRSYKLLGDLDAALRQER